MTADCVAGGDGDVVVVVDAAADAMWVLLREAELAGWKMMVSGCCELDDEVRERVANVSAGEEDVGASVARRCLRRKKKKTGEEGR
jgi:hypothetical protein